jgi:hypothetical protein
LGSAQGHRRIGADARCALPPSVQVEAARSVEGQYRSVPDAGPADQLGDPPLRVPVQPVADQRVDDQVHWCRVLADQDAHPDHDAGLLRGDRRERPAGQHDADGDRTVVQVPGRGQTAAVAPGPGEHHDRPRCDEGLPEVGRVRPRVLRHLGEIDAEVLGHGPVDLPHLPGAHRRDGLARVQPEHDG